MGCENINKVLSPEHKLKKQFDLRCAEFDLSANWITNKELIRSHIDLAGPSCGRALDLCCGTGQIGRALKSQGWDVYGLDISDGMARMSSRYFPVSKCAAERMPFSSHYFHLVVCRQTFQFLNAQKVLSEVARVLAPQGVFILSLTVPFSDKDYDWLYKIHRVKQPLLLKFYTALNLMDELRRKNFLIEETRILKVRESVTRWMQHAPELNHKIRDKVILMVKNAPADYKKIHNVEITGKEVLEDWNWVIFKASFRKN
ncbi:MAG: class I SAM-dependent methyltransferase [Candidatus Omnitrophica bacterium]|nr:class I SAM-dependent methyltransferase [Candidatus Omnitrophota bacterium]MBU1922991.1 class I SAM-dependent methyltransferase [Candidatus Omnitrophota bacterium]